MWSATYVVDTWLPKGCLCYVCFGDLAAMILIGPLPFDLDSMKAWYLVVVGLCAGLRNVMKCGGARAGSGFGVINFPSCRLWETE